MIFPTNYDDCRNNFLAASESAQKKVVTHQLEIPGEEGLACDICRIGSDSAKNVLIFTSGTHGPELPAGSYCQSRWLREGRFDQLSKDIAVVLIHAVNPWGARYNYRTNEDNIDLCRNHIDFSQPRVINRAYNIIHEQLMGQTPDTVGALLKKLEEKMGRAALLGALMSGQYDEPSGFSYGGGELAWSNKVLLSNVKSHTAKAQQVVIVDFHTGVGPYGYGSAISMQTGKQLERAHKYFGNWLVAPREKGGDDQFYTVTGHSLDGYARATQGKDLLNIVLEFGTLDIGEMHKLLLAQLLSQNTTTAGSPGNNLLSRSMVDAHSPHDMHWQRAVWERSEQALDQALSAMSCVLHRS